MQTSRQDAVLITGSHGGIGTALVEVFKEKGVCTIGLDCEEDNGLADIYLKYDLERLVLNTKAYEQLIVDMNRILRRYKLKGVVNNAAIQILGSFPKLTFEEFQRTLNINVSAPFIISKVCYKELSANNGVIINISSIHSKLTKPGFIAYATSKAALEGMTKAMAVDFGREVRVNGISPAAIETDMLKAGFNGREGSYELLKKHHPSGTVGKVSEIAEICSFIYDGTVLFLNGATIELGGGIHNRLHDPV